EGTTGREGRTERRRLRQRPRDATCGGSARRKPPPLRHQGRKDPVIKSRCEGGRVATHEAPPPARRAGEERNRQPTRSPRPQHCRGVCGDRTRPPVLFGLNRSLRDRIGVPFRERGREPMTESAVVQDRAAGAGAGVETLRNFIGGRWVPSHAAEFLDVHNPARGEVIAKTPLSTARDVDAAVEAAKKAFPAWRDTPPVVRARVLFKFKQQLEDHIEEIARIVTTEQGKTLEESRGSVRRGIECVEVACGTPSLMMGYGLENIASNIDCSVIRQPVGVCAAIAPFNFPAMVPLWFLPFAIGTGNTFVLKPSEQVPLSQKRILELLEKCDLPPGVVNLVNGGREAVEAICDHPGIRAVSFVGSTPVARTVSQRATHAGKRCQALGGAKNFIVVMPDADLDRATDVITESFFGCAGERCLAGSVLVPVGEAHGQARDRMVAAAKALKVGDG